MESQLFDGIEDENKNIDLEVIDDETDEWFIIFMRYLISSSIVLLSVFSILVIAHMVKRGQKTRNPQQRRAYMGNARRPSLTQAEPTIYVSPANLPPPPKYEAMAPPSYEEVVGIHYPGYRPPVQPITQPITTAMALSADNTGSGSGTNNNTDTPATVITVTAADTRTSVTVATS